jgi:uncharacterized protein YjiS (DUF1127 family)
VQHGLNCINIFAKHNGFCGKIIDTINTIWNKELKMRDYCLHEASSRAAYGRWSFAMRVWGNWKMRKTLRQLAKLADAQLYDMGLPRFLLNQLIAMPLTRDVAWDYERERLLGSRYGESLAQSAPAATNTPKSHTQVANMPLISEPRQYC